jgi:hypothetical protein
MERHRRRHGLEGREPLGVRARRDQAAQNRAASSWASFAGHRARVTGLVRAVQRGQGLCVLGAGNGDDLDLPALVSEFGEVHLVDLDGAALARSLARLPPAVAGRVALHGDVDVTGLLDGLERWGDDDALLASESEGAARALAARVGRTFDVVLSSCVLSQLCAPFTRVLARRGPEWTGLMGLLGRTHFELMARLLRPGGTGVALGDLYHGPASSRAEAPVGWDRVDRGAVLAARAGVMRLRDPAFLAALLAGPPVRDLLETARLTEPWLWNVEAAAMLVYAVVFERGRCG